MNCIKSIWMKIIKSWDDFWESYEMANDYKHEQTLQVFEFMKPPLY